MFLLISVETRTVINHAVNGRKYKIIYVKTSRPLITSIVQPAFTCFYIGLVFFYIALSVA